MLSLVPHILYGFIDYRLTDRKHSITTLPGELLVSGIYGLYPSATVAFYFLHEVRHIFVPRQHTQDMNMVADSAHTYYLTSGSVDQLADIFMHTV